MPLYEDDTLEGVIRKAVRGGNSAKSSETEQCENLRGRLHQALREMRRRYREFTAAKINFERTSARIPQAADDAERAERLADRATVIDAFAPGPGTVHGLMRVTDPGRLNVRQEQTWLTQVIRLLEDAVFPDRRARATREALLHLEGRGISEGQQLRRAAEEFSNARDRAMQAAINHQRCLILKPKLNLIGPQGTPRERIRQGMNNTFSRGKKK